MANWTIHPSQLSGNVFIPSSKSHTLRAILFAGLATGQSVITNVLDSPDTQAMSRAICSMGAKINYSENAMIIHGTSGHLQTPDDIIDCGNSGQVLRFIGALAALNPNFTILTGDNSIRHRRPIQPLIDGLNQLGAFASSSRGDGFAPLIVRGPITKSRATINGFDSQPVSGLLIAGAFAPHPIELTIENPKEHPWIDLTLNWFRQLNIPYKAQDYTQVQLNGLAQIQGFTYVVPGDFSSCAYPIAAALLTGSKLTVHNVDMNDIQGDKILIQKLQEMGARLIVDPQKKAIHIDGDCVLNGCTLDINDCIDALPILAVVGCFAKGQTKLVNASSARNKESNRIQCIAKELSKMGAKIQEIPDGLEIFESSLHGALLSSHQDHRIALSLAIAALAAQSKSIIEDIECTQKSYRTFKSDFQQLGARIL